MADVRDDGRDGALPYGVDTLVLRMEWAAPARPRRYNGRMWRMRPLRGWSGGQGTSQGLSGLDDGTAGPSIVPVTGLETVEAKRGWAVADGLAQESQSTPGVQYAQRGPPEEDETTRWAGPGGRALSDPELFRLERYNAMRSRLLEVDPKNPELQKQYVTGPEGFVPTQAEVDALWLVLEGARSGGPTPQGPVNTFANPGGPVSGDGVQNPRNSDGRTPPPPINYLEQAARPTGPENREDLAPSIVQSDSAELTRPQRGAVAKLDNIISNGARKHDFEGVLKELRGESTGFDHVTEMRNDVRGLRDALGSIQSSLANPNLTPDARSKLEAASERGQSTLERMQNALTGKR